MMKGILVVIGLLGVCAPQMSAQEDDPVVMTVAGEGVKRSEFEYSFNKNGGDTLCTDYDSIRKYAEMYLNYKMKVHAAEDAELDTLSSFRKEFSTYRDVQLRPYLRDTAYVDSVAREVYKVIETQVGDSDLVLASHFFLVIPQNASDSLIDAKQARIDSVYEALVAGADFAELCTGLSEDRMTKSSGGELPWLGPGQTVPEFEEKLYALKPGEMSEPFKSTAGLHILKVKERKKLEPYEEKKGEIEQLLVQRGINVAAAEHRVKTLMAERGASREEVLAVVQAEAAEKDANLPFLVQEYHDGLLMYEASKRFVWDVAQSDTTGMEKYFKVNKKRYQWESPRYKGFVVRAKSQALLDQILAFMKDNKVKDGEKLPLVHAAFKDSARQYKIRFGVYKEKDDDVVDYYEYAGEEPQTKRFGVNAVQGKMQKAPKVWTDVEADVKNDYQNLKENEWVEELRSKYAYSINEDVLRTVNNH